MSGNNRCGTFVVGEAETEKLFADEFADDSREFRCVLRDRRRKGTRLGE
jgi:hypothetical protein